MLIRTLYIAFISSSEYLNLFVFASRNMFWASFLFLLNRFSRDDILFLIFILSSFLFIFTLFHSFLMKIHHLYLVCFIFYFIPTICGIFSICDIKRYTYYIWWIFNFDTVLNLYFEFTAWSGADADDPCETTLNRYHVRRISHWRWINRI